MAATSPHGPLLDRRGEPRFDEIVVPLVNQELHDRGFTAAVELAERLRLPLRLVNVANAAGAPGDEADAARALAATRARFEAQHPDLEISHDLVVALDVAAGIADTLRPESLVVLATDHAGADDGSFSVAEGLARRWGGVLFMIGPKATITDLPGPVVVPLDGSPSGTRAVLAALALEGAWQDPLWLLHVVDASTSSKMAELREAGYAISESTFVRELADELTADSHAAGWEIVHDDDTVRAIVDFATERGAALITASTHGAGRSTRTFGSICMHVVHEASVPVAVIGSGGTPG